MKTTLLSLIIGAAVAVTPMVHAQLSEAAQLDLLKVEIGESLKSGNDEQFLRRLDEFESRGGTIDTEVLFFKAEALYKQGKPAEALDALSIYINSLGSSGVRYNDALVLYRDIEPAATVARERNQNTQALERFFESNGAVGTVRRVDREYDYVVIDKLDWNQGERYVVYDREFRYIVPVTILQANDNSSHSAQIENTRDTVFIQPGSELFPLQNQSGIVDNIIERRTYARLGVDVLEPSGERIQNRLDELGWKAAKSNCFSQQGLVISVKDKPGYYKGDEIKDWDLLQGLNGVQVSSFVDLFRVLNTHPIDEPVEVSGKRCVSKNTSSARLVDFSTSVLPLD